MPKPDGPQFIAFHGSFSEVPPHEQKGEENFHAASRPQGSIERLGLQMYANAGMAQDMGDDDSIGPYGTSPAYMHLYEVHAKPHPKVYSDPHANMDAYGTSYDEDEEQDESDIVPEHGTLTQPLMYRNQHEDAGQLSYVLPKHMVNNGKINYVGHIPVTVSQDAVPWTRDADYKYGTKDVMRQMGYDPKDFD
jgi:hypothetical protein